MMEENLQKLLGEDGTLSDLEEEVAAHKQELKGLQESVSFIDYLLFLLFIIVDVILISFIGSKFL